MLKENGVNQNLSSVNTFKVEDTGDKFYYETVKFDQAYEVKFVVHSNIYEESCCINCGYELANSIELPKKFIFNSTVEDVINAYGTPKEQNEYDYESCKNKKNTSCDYFGELEYVKES